MAQKAGYAVIVVTNQACVGRGELSHRKLQKIHQKLNALLRQQGGEKALIDDYYICPHRAEDDCDCRKPKTGLFVQVARDRDFDAEQTFFVGDALRDAQAARSASLRFALVKTGKGTQTQEKIQPACIFDDLFDFVANQLLAAPASTEMDQRGQQG